MLRLIGFIFFIIFSFMLDLTFFALVGYPVLFLMRSLFYALVPRAAFSSLLLAGSFVLLESFIVAHVFAADLVVMVPLSLLFYKSNQLADMTTFMQGLSVYLCVCIHFLVIDYWWLGLRMSFSLMLVNLLTALIMVYLVTGSRGNRSRT